LGHNQRFMRQSSESWLWSAVHLARGVILRYSIAPRSHAILLSSLAPLEISGTLEWSAAKSQATNFNWFLFSFGSLHGNRNRIAKIVVVNKTVLQYARISNRSEAEHKDVYGGCTAMLQHNEYVSPSAGAVWQCSLRGCGCKPPAPPCPPLTIQAERCLSYSG
jgi:hypothetical protein